METVMVNRRPAAALLRVFGVLCLLAFPALDTSAQFVGDGETLVLDAEYYTLTALLTVGTNGTNTELVLTNGTELWLTGGGIVGRNASASNNRAFISGSGTLWSNTSSFEVGFSGSANRLTISDGGLLVNSSGSIGTQAGARNNQALVSGTGSVWSNRSGVLVGQFGSSNHLTISNGGAVFGVSSMVGANSGSNNSALITGSNSLWLSSGLFYIGFPGPGSRVTVEAGGKLVVATNLAVGTTSPGTNNLLIVSNATVIVTNAAGTGTLAATYGTIVFHGGNITADSLSVSRSNAGFTFNAGLLNVGACLATNGKVFAIGNGASTATYRMSGSITNSHSFSNGLVISSNSTLTGNGTIFGNVTNFGTLDVGGSAGAINVSGDFRFEPSATAVFEIGGSTPTNAYDQLTVTGSVQFGGTLALSLTNGFLPAPGNSFTIMTFGSAVGSFGNVSGGRVALANGLASFAITQTSNSLILGGVLFVDTDGDGQGDLQELAAGTDPNDPASALAVTSITASGNIVVQFRSVPGKTYRIEHSAGVGPWSIATTNVPATGTSTQWIDDGSLTGGLPVGQRFYRVGLQ